MTGKLTEIKKMGQIEGQMKTEPIRTLIPTQDCREYYVKHAIAFNSKEELKLIFGNIQTATTFHNNVSLWTSWKFAKQMGIFIFLKLLEYEEKFGIIELDDTTTLANFKRVLDYLNKYKISEIERQIKTIEGDLVEISFKCTNEKCNKINIGKFPKNKLPKKKGIIDMICQYCSTEIRTEYKPPKKERENKKT